MMPVQEFDQYARNYSQDIEQTLGVFGKGHDFYVRSKADILNNLFGSLGRDGRGIKVLDVGCGVGLVHPLIVGSVGELHGFDVSEDSIEVARRDNPGVSYRSSEPGPLPYEDHSFDCAYAICVLHHVPVEHWASFTREMARVVRPGGIVVFIEHNPFNPATRWVVNNCPIDKDAVLVKPSRLGQLMADAGAGATDVNYVLFTPFEGKAFRRLDDVLSRVPLGAQYVSVSHIGPSTAASVKS
jgi:ubiquinone/menaquinone biosynthesis C-methylase UbiE